METRNARHVVAQNSYVKVEAALPDATKSGSAFLNGKVHLVQSHVDGRTNEIIHQREGKERCWLYSDGTGISGKLMW